MMGLLGAEFLKLRKRWMPYVLFLLMLVGAAFLIWAVGYGTWDSEDEEIEWKLSAMRTFLYPYSVPALLDSGQFWGSAIFVGILTTSTLATEHSWGTIRPALTGGVSRARYLATKLGILLAVSTVALLVAFGFGVLMSLGASDVSGLEAPAAHPESFGAADFLVMLSRTALCILPYGLLAFALTVISRSTALGIAGTMGYMVIEAIIVAALDTGGDLLQTPRLLFVGHSAGALIAENRFGGLEHDSMAFRDLNSPDKPSVWTATGVIVLECLALLGAAFAVFLRRDVTVSDG